ncbi:Hpt domain-containing protein [Colwellia sp. C1TZA3]|uniref:Hpt domain-containing protein n=1 Tax=Colwellia sp. C1TZA3 TaxID=2508879 RepID=UPI0011BA10AA|nr:Hpt domain-containing protein [Colwellia sp. C1TZA3]TWX71643.1 phosphorelay protein [Colwellia sp. C1TZA3]
MATTQHIDLILINGYLEALDLAVIEQMLDLYIEQSALYLTAINRAVVNMDEKAWQEQCHKMKGAAASTGLSQVHQKLLLIEKSHEDAETKAQHLQALSLLNQQAIAAFQQWFAEQ